MARPFKKVDPQRIEDLARVGCTVEQISSVVGISKRTIERNYDAAIKKGRDNGIESILRKQFDVALAGNVTMLIWLGKQRCGQSDKIEQRETVEHKGPIVYETKWGDTTEATGPDTEE